MIDINNYTGKKPQSFILENEEIKAETWAEMAVLLFEKLYQKEPHKFEELAQKKFKNPKSPLVAKNEYDILNRSKKLKNAEIYIEMHHSTASFIRFMKSILEEYKLLEKFEIKTKENA